MSYATLEEMLARFEREDLPELTQVTAGVGGVRDDTRITTALAEASGEMDLYLGTVHALPLTDLTATQTTEMARLCCDIARYRLWAEAASDEVRRRYDDALKVLAAIAAGKVRLLAPATGGVRGQAWAQASPRQMSRDQLAGVL